MGLGVWEASGFAFPQPVTGRAPSTPGANCPPIPVSPGLPNLSLLWRSSGRSFSPCVR